MAPLGSGPVRCGSVWRCLWARVRLKRAAGEAAGREFQFTKSLQEPVLNILCAMPWVFTGADRAVRREARISMPGKYAVDPAAS